VVSRPTVRSASGDSPQQPRETAHGALSAADAHLPRVGEQRAQARRLFAVSTRMPGPASSADSQSPRRQRVHVLLGRLQRKMLAG